MNKISSSTSHVAFIGLSLIILLGAFLRVNVSLHTLVEYPLRSDAGQYFSYAFNLRHDGVYSLEPRFAQPDANSSPVPDALRSPGYPIALLPFAGEIPTDRTILNIALMQALLGTLMIPLAFMICRSMVPDRWALLPAVLVAISPQLVNMGVYVLSESVFSFLMLLAIFCMITQFKRTDQIIFAMLSGMLVGIAALTRPTLQYLLPVIFVGLFPLFHVKERWRQGVWLTIGFAATFLPWIVRNLITLGVVSDPTLSISAIVHGHYPNMMFAGRMESLGYPYRFDPQISEISISMRAALDGIWQRVVDAPLTYAEWYLVGKPLAFFSWSDVASAGDIFTYPTMRSPYYGVPLFMFTKSFMEYTHYMWVALAFAVTTALLVPALRKGIEPHHRIPIQLLVCILAYFIAIHTVGFPLARYQVPLLPVVFVLATYGIVSLLGLRTRLADQ